MNFNYIVKVRLQGKIFLTLSISSLIHELKKLLKENKPDSNSTAFDVRGPFSWGPKSPGGKTFSVGSPTLNVIIRIDVELQNGTENGLPVLGLHVPNPQLQLLTPGPARSYPNIMYPHKCGLS